MLSGKLSRVPSGVGAAALPSMYDSATARVSLSNSMVAVLKRCAPILRFSLMNGISKSQNSWALPSKMPKLTTPS
ncbi:hypothetical protein D9M71_766260 [compost metagenome]